MRVNRYLEAFKESYNAIGLAGAAALSAATLSPLPLLAGLVAEVAYLLMVPDTQWYEARLAKRFDAEVEARRRKIRDQVMPTLRPEMQARFQRLESMRTQIDANAQENKEWFREVLRKLDYLLEKFLLFASREAQFRAYLQDLRDEVRGGARPTERDEKKRKGASFERGRESRGLYAGDDAPRRPLNGEERERSGPPPLDGNDRWIQQAIDEVQGSYDRERENLEARLQAEENYDTKAVLEKRVEVLRRRAEFVSKMGKILTNINHQLQLLEDTFGLINDEIRARSPEQILADIEEVVVATDTMASALEELAPYEQLRAS